MTLLGTISPTTSGGTVSISNTSTFQYVHVISTITATGGGGIWYSTDGASYGVKVQHAAGGYTGLINGTDFTVATDATTGKPKITYTDSSTVNLTYNETTLLLVKVIGVFIRL